MINEPAVDNLLKALNTEDMEVSRYELCIMVAKRARQIIDQEQSQGLSELPGNVKEIALACQEILSGKVVAFKD